jgi:hypothetical protein
VFKLFEWAVRLQNPAGINFEDVQRYAANSVRYFLSQHATRLSPELREEIFQDAMLRVWSAFQKMHPHKGWKSFVQIHCRGAVLDYLKGANGFSVFNVPKSGDEQLSPLFNSTTSLEGPVVSHDIFAGESDEYSDAVGGRDGFQPNWELLCRMAGADDELHIVCKYLLGFTQQEIADQFLNRNGERVSRERISQKIHAFFERLDSPEFYFDAWTHQCIFALGLSERFHQKVRDNGMGWRLPLIDLLDAQSFLKLRADSSGSRANEPNH